MIRVGIVAEGPTDISVLEAIMRTIVAEIEFVHIHLLPPLPPGSATVGEASKPGARKTARVWSVSLRRPIASFGPSRDPGRLFDGG